MSNRRTTTDFPRNEAGLVDQFLGTAYDVVKVVHDNLDVIQEVYEAIEAIETIDTLAADAVEEAMVPARAEIAESTERAEAVAVIAEAMQAGAPEDLNTFAEVKTALDTKPGLDQLYDINTFPEHHGATGNGATNDLVAMVESTAVSGKTVLTKDETYNIGNSFAGDADPEFYPDGAGKLAWNGIPLKGFELKFDIKNASIYATPDSWFRATRAASTLSPMYPPYAPPGRGSQLVNIFNTVISQGSKLDRTDENGAKVAQVTAVGSNIGVTPKEWLLVDAYGQDAMMFAQFAERCSAGSSENMVWGGCTSQQHLIDTNADWYRNVPPNQWTAENNEIEAATPGIGMRIFNFNEWATSIADFGHNNTFGRDAGVGLMVGSYNNFFGYSAGGSTMKGSGNTYMGHCAGRNAVFSNDQILIGMWTGNASTDGERNVIAGNHAVRVANAPKRSVVFGYGAARNAKKVEDSVIIGHGAADASGAEYLNKFILANSAGTSKLLATGDFLKKRLTIASGTFEEHRAPLHVKTGSTKTTGRTAEYNNALLIDGNPAELVLETTGGTGFSTIKFVGHDGITGAEMNYGQSGKNFNFIVDNASRWRMMSTGELRPGTDNLNPVGSAANRISQLFAGTATINTSDARAKTTPIPISDKILDAWAEVQYCSYQFRDAVETKGSGARWHMGIIAQQVHQVFEAHDIDGFSLGLLCHDVWDAEYEEFPGTYETVPAVYSTVLGGDGKPMLISAEREVQITAPYKVKIVDAGERYGIRYEEALCLEAALMRRTNQRILQLLSLK